MLKAKLIVYGRDDCHLCEQMLDEINAFRKTYAHLLELDICYSNIDRHTTLSEQYNLRVPLLIEEKNNSITELCEYFFDADVLIKYFSITD